MGIVHNATFHTLTLFSSRPVFDFEIVGKVHQNKFKAFNAMQSRSLSFLRPSLLFNIGAQQCFVHVREGFHCNITALGA